MSNCSINNPLQTREDLQRLARDLVEPIAPHFSPGRAFVRLGETRGQFGDPAGWLEGFARPLWGLAPLAAGAGEFDHWELWRQGLANGTDPAHEEYWGRAGDFDQRCVEMAPIGFALALAREQLWYPLSPDARLNLVAWLKRIEEVRLPRCNWLFFRVLVHLGLRAVGESLSARIVAGDLNELESYAVEDGWYTDGPTGRRGDYYVPMAIHLGGLVYAKLTGDTRFVPRAVRFAEDFQHYFAADGSALPFGRSLTYHFAQGAFWGALAFADVEALPWSAVKGLYLRHLRWWLRQPIFSETGLLTVGYAYPNVIMAEAYNSSQSAYWGFKALLPLALPESHPFWQAEEAPLPPRRSVHTIPGAGLVLTTDPHSGDITALNAGQPVLDSPRHAGHKYSKLAYSTRFAFSIPTGSPTPAEGGFDGDLALSDDGRHYRRRDFCEEPMVHDGVATSLWRPWPEVEIRTWLIAESAGHIRVHLIRSGRPLRSLEGGFAVPHNSPLRLAGQVVRAESRASVLVDLSGGRKSEIVALGANSHLLASLATMPTLAGEHEPGEFWLVVWAGGSADESDTFEEAQRFTFEGQKVLKNGEPWWSPDDGSSAARLQATEETMWSRH